MTLQAKGAIAVLLTAFLALLLALSYFHGRTDGARGPRAELAALAAAAAQQKVHYDEALQQFELDRKIADGMAATWAQRAASLAGTPPYRDTTCLDPAGVRLANDALANGAASTDDALPAPVTAP